MDIKYKEKSDELIVAIKELVFQNEEKEKRAAELIIANKKLVFQNEEKEKRAAELGIANKELAFQNDEKEKRAEELGVEKKELVFQNRINETNNSNSLVENINHSVDAKGVQLNFPKQFADKKITGEILFFRPSDNTKDFKEKIDLNNNQQFINKEKLSRGMYKMQISWIAEEKKYYNEETIVIP